VGTPEAIGYTSHRCEEQLPLVLHGTESTPETPGMLMDSSACRYSLGTLDVGVYGQALPPPASRNDAFAPGASVTGEP
jgi:hypothetical protein